MDKRDFLKVTGVIAAGSVLSPFIACTGDGQPKDTTTAITTEGPKSFKLPALDFGFDALQPNIDARTMEIHHDKHHAGYVKKLNAALEGSDFAGMTLENMMGRLKEGDTAVRNNGGGHYNHSLFWKVLSPNGGGAPTGAIGDAINASFGSFDKFKEAFSAEAKGVFGSGWAWLSMGADKKLFVSGTPNQDNPLMKGLVEQTGTPILGIDVWEHAYYLNYQNRRGDYIGNFYNVINWKAVEENLKKIG